MQNHFQRWIFKEIEKKYTKKVEAIPDLSKLLGVGKDGVYRRYRGESILKPEEIEILAKTYKLSLDNYVYRDSDSVFFTYGPFAEKVTSFEGYFKKMEAELTQLSGVSSIHMRYAVPELPIFHIFFIPELLSFKLFTWGRTSWDFDYLQNEQFDFDLIPYPVLKLAEPIVDLYTQIPSTELWGLNLIDFTLNQIEYYMNSDAFATDTIPLVLCDKLLELLKHMERMAKAGQKFKPGEKPRKKVKNFELYHNEVLYTDHTILLSTDVEQAVYTTFGHPDFIKTTDERVIQHIDDWFVKILSKASSISINGEKTRKWYFNHLRKKVRDLKKRLKNEIELQ